eukprot:6212686-Pleurochrysis_carterae.AAC.1
MFASVAASSCQAETAADCVADQRNTFLRNLLGRLLDAIGTKLSGGATVFLMDISAAVTQAGYACASKKTEHYERWEYYLREGQLEGSIKAHFIRICDQNLVLGQCTPGMQADLTPRSPRRVGGASWPEATGAPPSMG